MSREITVWNDTQFVCMRVADGVSQSTVSLTFDEAFDIAQKLMPRAEFSADTTEELRQTARMIRTWIPEIYPANEKGQVHFARAVMESVATVIERAIDGQPPLTDDEVMASSAARTESLPLSGQEEGR